MIPIRGRIFQLVAMLLVSWCLVAHATPEYLIFSLGVAQSSDTSGTGMAVSNNGTYITGFSSGAGVNNAFLWTQIGGNMPLPALANPPRAFNAPQGVNDAGTAVGIGSTTFFGSSALPVIWKQGTATQLPLPLGETVGRAYAVNNSELAVGSVSGGSTETAAMYSMSSVTVITETMPNGGRLTTAYDINDAGRVVGQALDPSNAAVTKGFYLDPGDGMATDIGALSGAGHNSAIAFAVSSNGLVAGASSLNSGVGTLPFLWSEMDGMQPVPLPPGTTTGSARGVNASGWVVGNASAATSVPFLYDGMQSYTLESLIPLGTGWNLTAGTSNAAFGISDNGVITGRGLLNGIVTGFAMIPVPEPTGLWMLGLAVVWFRRR